MKSFILTKKNKAALNQRINSPVTEGPSSDASALLNLCSGRGRLRGSTRSRHILWKHTRRVIKDVIIWEELRSDELRPPSHQLFYLPSAL